MIIPAPPPTLADFNRADKANTIIEELNPIKLPGDTGGGMSKGAQ
jgi:hypothetical protein